MVLEENTFYFIHLMFQYAQIVGKIIPLCVDYTTP